MEPGICIYIRKLLDNGRKRVNQLHKVISNRNINLSACRLLLLSVIRPSIDGLLALVNEYIVDVWEIRKHKLYDSDSGSGLQLRTQSSPGERSGKFSQNGKFGQNGKLSQNGKFGQNGMSGQKGKVHLGPNVSSSLFSRKRKH